MTSPRISFAPRLAALVRSEQDGQPDAARRRAMILLRLGAVLLLVCALTAALHFGTAAHRDAERKARIEQAIATSGVVPAPAATAASGGREHE
jgi:hypothetical protein